MYLTVFQGVQNLVRIDAVLLIMSQCHKDLHDYCMAISKSVLGLRGYLGLKEFVLLCKP